MEAPPKAQFSLRTIMITMAAVCFLCAFFFAFPRWLQFVTIRALNLAAAAAVASLVVYGRDSLRAFGIGAAIPLVAQLFSQSSGFLLPSESMRYFGVGDMLGSVFQLVHSLLSGAVCVFARKWVINRQRNATNSVDPPPISDANDSTPPIYQNERRAD